MFDEEGQNGPRKYDGSLRASIKKPLSLGSNQWLRNSEGEKVESRMAEEVNEALKEMKIQGKGVTEARESGENQRDLRSFNGSQVIEFVEGHDKDNLNDGVIFSKQKRARTKEGVTDGDIEMSHGLDYSIGLNEEVYAELEQNHLNLALAGPVTQARPPQ